MKGPAMTTPESLLSLANRVEEAKGPDRELDALIWCTIRGVKYVSHNEAYSGFGRPNPETQVEYREPPRRVALVSTERTGHAKPWTASIDAAMTLVPEGWRPLIDCTPDDKPVVELFADEDVIRPIARGCGRVRACLQGIQSPSKRPLSRTTGHTATAPSSPDQRRLRMPIVEPWPWPYSQCEVPCCSLNGCSPRSPAPISAPVVPAGCICPPGAEATCRGPCCPRRGIDPATAPTMAEEVSMRERLRRAIERADCHSVGFLDRAVDAVLDELWEPSDAMKRAWIGPRQWDDDALEVYRAMIEAAKS